jgi:hypothetical protein
MDNWVTLLSKKAIFVFLLGIVFCSCSHRDHKRHEFTFQEISENEIEIDFQKINPGSWDTLLIVQPYTQGKQINLGSTDNEFLASHARADFHIVVGFLEQGELEGYTLASREPDLLQLFNVSDSVGVKKITRSAAVIRFVKHKDGSYQLKTKLVYNGICPTYSEMAILPSWFDWMA